MKTFAEFQIIGRVGNVRNSTFPIATVRPGTYVVWRNLDPYPHSAETESSADFYFNAGPLLPGEVSPPVLFSKFGEFPYRCRYHAGMSSMVHVRDDAPVAGISETIRGLNHGDHGGHVGSGPIKLLEAAPAA